jgi:hypothetical protein
MTRESGIPSRSNRTPRVGVSSALARWVRAIGERLRAASFWLAVGLPWLLLALAAGGVVTERPAFAAALVATTVLCAVAGHDHAKQ